MTKQKNSELKTYSIFQGNYFTFPLTNETQGYKELINAIQMKLDTMDVEGRVHYLQEVYNDSLVYEVRGGDHSGFYKRTYSNTNGQIEFTGDPVAVRRKTEFIVQEIQDMINQKLLDHKPAEPNEVKLFPTGVTRE